VNADRYPTRVFWSDDDEGFIAEAIDLPGCSAFGETQHEALTQLMDAIKAWIEAATAAGNPIPAPSNPAAEENYSGKVLVRMPKTLHAQLAKSARAETTSLNQYIVFLLIQANTLRNIETSFVSIIGRWKERFLVWDNPKPSSSQVFIGYNTATTISDNFNISSRPKRFPYMSSDNPTVHKTR
jgi:predicted RNase H-like HicB family nuclease